MPVRRKYRGRKRVRGRKLNQRQKVQVKRILGVRTETKYLDVATAASTVSTTPGVFSLTLIPQATVNATDSVREGDRVYLKKLYIRGTWFTGDTTQICRLIFFQWKPNSAASPGNILTNGPSGTIDVNSHYVHDNRQMYKILWDKTFLLEGNGSAATAPVTTGTQKRFQLILNRGLLRQLQFAQGTTVSSNAVYFLSISDSAAVTHPTLNMMTRVMFTDS